MHVNRYTAESEYRAHHAIIHWIARERQKENGYRSAEVASANDRIAVDVRVEESSAQRAKKPIEASYAHDKSLDQDERQDPPRQ